jgi:hypothetical protein
MRNTILLCTAAIFLAAGCASVPQKAGSPNERTGMAASMIAEAEQLGAKECAPRNLAKAKVALDHVVHEVNEGYYHATWLEPDIAKAEKTAGDLLAERKFAATLGIRFRCVTGQRGESDDAVPRSGG